ncbi:two-component system response regulator [Dokdonella sp.]|uniref:HD-GYP domain-containing protein n=1 Tax=Dokdonella sp. TaxID=2291710 RepID=UPI001B1D9C44|nr:two-component system response regulator [Dokdonella sp.]MBO9663138.1 two-component system response regulator [Dokdonella sp.]
MNVLIVDDQPSARTMLRHVVEAIGPGVRAADFGSPVEALRWSEGNITDLVLLDFRMPEMDGLEFARRFRRSLSRRDVPIVLISVVGDEPVRQAALEAGVIDFLVKPVRPRELRTRCKNLLQLRQQGESIKERARSLESRVLESLHEVEQRERETLYRLAKAIEYRDLGTGIHLLRMSHYAEVIAEALGMPDEETRILTSAAPLHDIGKIGIPDSVLLKRGSLTDEEFAVMRRHPLIGYEILRDSRSRFVQMGALIALRHHERWDGSGYPDGLKGDAIPLPARIVAVADVFDALTSVRPYKPAWSSEEALDYLKANRGTLFDPACVDVVVSHQARILEILHAKLAPPGLGV